MVVVVGVVGVGVGGGGGSVMKSCWCWLLHAAFCCWAAVPRFAHTTNHHQVEITW